MPLCALARDAVRLTGCTRLALAGGVVSNVKATRRVRLLPEVEEVYVFPHMGDGGLALGAAIALRRRPAASLLRMEISGSISGPAYDRSAIESSAARRET